MKELILTAQVATVQIKRMLLGGEVFVVRSTSNTIF